MKLDFAKKMEAEIAKVQDQEEKSYLEKILSLEITGNVDIEEDMIQCAIVPIQIGAQMNIDSTKSAIYYQHYRTMKSILKKSKEELSVRNHERIEEGIQFLIGRIKDLEPERSLADIETDVRKMISETNIEEICNRIGFDLTKEPEVEYDEDGEPIEVIDDEDDGPTVLDLFHELTKDLKTN